MIRKTIYPPIIALVLMRSLRWGNTWIASDDVNYEALQHVAIRDAIARGETIGATQDIAWRVINASDIVEIIVHPDCYDSGHATMTRIIPSVEVIDNRYGDLALGSDCDDCVWAEIARMIRAGETNGLVEYRAEHNALDRRTLRWERI